MPDTPRTYYLGSTSNNGQHSVTFAIGSRRYEYILTPQNIESVEYLCRKISVLKGLNFARRRAKVLAKLGA